MKFLFFLGLGGFLIWLAVKDKTDQELQNIRDAVAQANYSWIFLSLIVSGLSHYFRALRWKLLLQPLQHQPNTSNTFFAVMVGYLANCALPRLGEVTRCGILNRYEKVPFTEGFGTVIAERAMDMLCLILIFFMSLGVEFTKIYGIADRLIFSFVGEKWNLLMGKPLLLAATGVSILLLTVLLFYFRKRIATLFTTKVGGLIKGLGQGLMSVKKVNKPYLFLLYTALIWLMYFLQVYVCFFAFGETSSLSFMVAVIITVFGSLGVVAVPGGTGAYQAIIIQILTTVYLISGTNAFAFAWAVWTAQILLILVLGGLSLILLPLINREAKS